MWMWNVITFVCYFFQQQAHMKHGICDNTTKKYTQHGSTWFHHCFLCGFCCLTGQTWAIVKPRDSGPAAPPVLLWCSIRNTVQLFQTIECSHHVRSYFATYSQHILGQLLMMWQLWHGINKNIMQPNAVQCSTCHHITGCHSIPVFTSISLLEFPLHFGRGRPCYKWFIYRGIL